MRKGHALLQASGARRVLEQGDVFRLAGQAAAAGKIRRGRTVSLVADNHRPNRVFTRLERRPDLGFELPVGDDRRRLGDSHQ